PVRTRHLAVGDVADEQVAERVLELAGDRGRAVAADELLPLELVQAPLELALLAAGERGERPGPERLADDGRVLAQRLLLRLEQVEACRDHALDALRERLDAPALAQHPDELLGVERVAAGAREQLRL